MNTKVVKAMPGRTRRRHDPEFKAQVIAACHQPGVSLAAVALANGLNANMLRKWVRDHRMGARPEPALPDRERTPTAMVPAMLESDRPPAEIRIDVRRGGTTIQMAWPVDAAASLGACLRELLE